MNINFVAIIIAGLASMPVGFIWYSPALFAKEWMQLVGLTKEKMEKNKSKMPQMYGTALLGAMVMSFVLSQFIAATNTHTTIQGITTALLIWIGFVATTGLTNTLFSGRPTKLFLIDAGYHLAVLVVMGAILGSL